MDWNEIGTQKKLGTIEWGVFDILGGLQFHEKTSQCFETTKQLCILDMVMFE